MTQITKRQKETLDFIIAYRAKNGYAPSLEEIKTSKARFGLYGTSSREGA